MTTKNNKIIAEFMEYKKNTPSKDFFQHPTEKNRYDRIEFLSYNSDWNWLMEVVEKIESILPDDSIITIEYKNCFIPVLDDEEPFTIEGGGKTKIEAVYNACLEFIKWYNENSAKEK